MDRRIGVLNEARQQADEHGACLRLGKLFSNHLDGRGRRNLAQVHSPHPIGNREQVSVRAGLLARFGNERPHRVLVVGANLSEIGCLAELNVEHGRRCLKRSPG